LSALRTLGLTKTYGTRSALAGVDLVVPEGSLYGLVGPNGSGKTTLIEILAGLRRASGGVVELGVGEGEVAYCPDVAEFESWLTAAEVLEAALGLNGHRRPRRDLVVLAGAYVILGLGIPVLTYYLPSIVAQSNTGGLKLVVPRQTPVDALVGSGSKPVGSAFA